MTPLRREMAIMMIDGDIVTYDNRMKNRICRTMFQMRHRIPEHLFATYARNSEISDKVIYIKYGDADCGFYFTDEILLPRSKR